VRVLRRFDVYRDGGLITCEVEGTAFLKNMVRILVGTLVAVGHGKMAAATISELLTHGDRTKAGMTAPACGLTLAKVIY
jgi:tRNA pseudouridine38-40 synthase